MVSTCLATVEALEKNLLQSSPKTKLKTKIWRLTNMFETIFQNNHLQENNNSGGNLHLY